MQRFLLITLVVYGILLTAAYVLYRKGLLGVLTERALLPLLLIAFAFLVATVLLLVFCIVLGLRNQRLAARERQLTEVLDR